MSKKIIVKIIIFAVLLIAVLGIAASIIADHLEKSEWSNKQAEIDDQCIYSQRSDKFGFKFYYDFYDNTGFKMRIDQSYKQSGAEYINMEEGLEKFISIKTDEIIALSDEPKTEFVRLDLTYSEILKKYTVGDFGIFKWASETAIKNIEDIQKEYGFFLWQDKYLVCIRKTTDADIGSASICDINTGKAYVFEKGMEACYPENISVGSDMIEPVYYVYYDTLICVYKYYNKIYVTRLDQRIYAITEYINMEEGIENFIRDFPEPNKIKVAKQIGYGYRNEDYFFTLIRYLSLLTVRRSNPTFP